MYKLNRADTALVVIDMQEKLAAAMDEEMLEPVLMNSALLAAAFQEMGLPVIETLQYPKGLGETVEDLEPALRIEKMAFSACKVPAFNDFLKNKGIKSVVLIGMEAHICVLQTALDLIDAGYSVHVASDAVISRNDFNWETALDMMQNAGAVITVAETAIFQLLGSAEAKEFKDIQKLMKEEK